MWGVKDGNPRRREPRKARDCAGLRAVRMDDIGMHVPNDPRKPRQRHRVRAEGDRAPEIELYVCYGPPRPGRDRRRAEDDLVALGSQPVSQVADMTPDSTVDRLVTEQNAHHAGLTLSFGSKLSLLELWRQSFSGRDACERS